MIMISEIFKNVLALPSVTCLARFFLDLFLWLFQIILWYPVWAKNAPVGKNIANAKTMKQAWQITNSSPIDLGKATTCTESSQFQILFSSLALKLIKATDNQLIDLQKLIDKKENDLLQ